MEIWKIVIGLIVLGILGIIGVFIYKNEIWLTGFRVICDTHDQKAFNAIVDVMVEQYDIRQSVYREREDVIIFDIYCQKWKKKKIKSFFKKIENVEVQ